MPKFELIEESVAYKRYLTLFDRQVRVTSEKTGQATTLAYDVIGHPRCNFRFAVVLPFHTASKDTDAQVTMIREFCQGPNAVCYNLPTGGFDPAKHTSIEDCARAELSEEALLKGGELVRLIPEDHPGFAEVKWCANRFVPFLVIDPHVDPKPGARDAEEFIEVKRVGMEEFRNLNDGGDLMLPSMVTANLALKYLEKRGFV
eukprot:CAMPEP_0202358498 /NCGR_PEP_ID=MMETSP1126-20121109/12143_1 /ASSEMBLY_ACC=CAM_ASM_000457 /TAXON_ID=3047 /ORGANISM="Dunaliella tertiolecta, Strain CCMP1320" /LENGTH=201 /DNA_ID=CAMNT_0048951675 /DNA_START=186 /DNA_END=791 /DNA_ORIENTATION=-